ncbi:MAG: DNA replication and repair protein RecF, partial [Alphaproteobacteria bacterium]|nr:DNA replication and repair protein RecF [Alphaproteobacteria bacterium]
YEYAMRERNRLLALGRSDAQWLEALERKMAETGIAIAAARLHTVEHINGVMQASPLSFPKAVLALHGLAEGRLSGGEAALSVEHAMAEALARSRVQDAAAGRALAGAHRSELTVTHAQKQVEAATCSTGEQKALLLSIVLAEARAAGVWGKPLPVLLLDEALSHLDAARRAELFHEIEALGTQAWLTGTELSLFEGMRDNTLVFRVEQGRVIAL